jgi:hypothetical protein
VQQADVSLSIEAAETDYIGIHLHQRAGQKAEAITWMNWVRNRQLIKGVR